MLELSQSELFISDSFELLIVPEFMSSHHPHSALRHELTILFDCLHSIAESVFFCVVFGFDLIDLFRFTVILLLFGLLLFFFGKS